MTEQRISQIHAENPDPEDAYAQMFYEMGYEYYLEAGNVDHGEGLEQVFGHDFFRGFMAAKRTPAHLLKRATATA